MADVERHWPWITLVAAVVANVLSGGVVRSYGIIYMDFRDRLETSGVETIVIAALAFGLAGLIAPLAEGLSKKLGCFLVTLFGTIGMCLGFIVSAFLTKVLLHYITLGVLVGLGSGLVHIASIVAVSNMFNDRPVLVYALLSMAFPLGTFLFGFISRGLLDRYSYFGTFLVLAAIVANCIVCGILYKPLSFKRKKSKIPAKQSSTYERMETPVDEVEDVEEGLGEGDDKNADIRDVDVRETDSPVETETSKIHKPGHFHYNSVTGPTEEIVVSANTDVIRFSDYVVDDEVYVSSDEEEVAVPHDNGNIKVTEEPKMEQSMHTLGPSTDESNGVADQKPEEKVTEEPPPSLLRSISDPRTLCNWRFLILIVAVLLYSVAFGVPLLCYPDLSREHEITDWRAVWCLTVIGVLSSFSVVVSEFSLQRLITDYPRTIVVLLALSTIVGGVIIAFAHYYSNFEKLLLSALLFGMFSAPCRSLGVSTYVIEETTSADDVMPFYVWGNFVSGVGFLIGLPVAGVLHDTTGDYSWSFAFSGICFVMSAILSIFIVFHRRGHVRLID